MSGDLVSLGPFVPWDVLSVHQKYSYQYTVHDVFAGHESSWPNKLAGSCLPPEATFLVCQKVTLSIFYSTFQSHDPIPWIKLSEIKEYDDFVIKLDVCFMNFLTWNTWRNQKVYSSFLYFSYFPPVERALQHPRPPFNPFFPRCKQGNKAEAVYTRPRREATFFIRGHGAF